MNMIKNSSDFITIKCNSCDRTTLFPKDGVISEAKRLQNTNAFEILSCQFCSKKFSKEDFEKALGIFKFNDATKINDAIEYNEPLKSNWYSDSIYQTDYNNEQVIKTQLKKEELKKETEKNLQEELKKMQDGKPYNKNIVGNVDMESGTPGDRRCVTLLKKEGELYAYSFIIIDYLITGFITILVGSLSFLWSIIKKFVLIIWDIIKKINWCIICSIIRIGYFISYIGLIVYGIITTFILHETIFNSIYINLGFKPPVFIWIYAIIITCTFPLLAQLSWAFHTPTSRWAKVIKKRTDEIIK